MKINNHNLVVPKVLLGMMEKVRTKFMIEDIEDDEFEGADSENEQKQNEEQVNTNDVTKDQ